jgi:hypothetical protein
LENLLCSSITQKELVPSNETQYFDGGKFVNNGVLFCQAAIETPDHFSVLGDGVFDCLDLWDNWEMQCELGNNLFLSPRLKTAQWAMKKNSGLIRNTEDYDVEFNCSIPSHLLGVIRDLELTRIWEDSEVFNFSTIDFQVFLCVPKKQLQTKVVIGFNDVFENVCIFKVNKIGILALLNKCSTDDFVLDLKTGRLVALDKFKRPISFTQLNRIDKLRDWQNGFPIYICRSMLAHIAAKYKEFHFHFTKEEYAVGLNKKIILRSWK